MADFTGYGPPPETALRTMFEESNRWGVVLLLDEADVILEKRSLKDVRRNAIVTAFLRMLEYFNGVIFMTTNRLHTIDIAFQSRIHVAIEYKALTSSTRAQIWTRFIEKLENGESKSSLLDNMSYLKKLDINGRQIRNVLNLAQSLAMEDGDKKNPLSIEHVRDAANETLSFQRFFKDDTDTTYIKLKSGSPDAKMGKGKTESDEEDDDDDYDSNDDDDMRAAMDIPIVVD